MKRGQLIRSRRRGFLYVITDWPYAEVVKVDHRPAGTPVIIRIYFRRDFDKRFEIIGNNYRRKK